MLEPSHSEALEARLQPRSEAIARRRSGWTACGAASALQELAMASTSASLSRATPQLRRHWAEGESRQPELVGGCDGGSNRFNLTSAGRALLRR